MDNDFKDRVKDALDVSELFASYGHILKKEGDHKSCCCPFHQEKTPSCHVWVDHYKCFGCDVGGDGFEFIMATEAVEFPEALKILAEFVNIPMPEAGKRGSGEAGKQGSGEAFGRQEIIEVQERAATFYNRKLRTKDGQHALEYCHSRGISDELINRYGIGYSPAGFAGLQRVTRKAGYSNELLVAAGLLGVPDGKPAKDGYSRFQDRLMFPVCNRRGQVVGFSGRRMVEPDKNNKPAKYVNTPETSVYHKGDLVYGLHLAIKSIRSSGFVILVEGQMDVVGCGIAGLYQAVAPLGTALTPRQATIISRLADRVVIAFDGDAAGQAATEKAIDLFTEKDIVVTVAQLPQGTDPGSMVEKNEPGEKND